MGSARRFSGGVTFGEEEVTEEAGEEAEGTGGVGGGGEAEAAELAAKRGAEDEAEAEDGADQAEAFHPVFGRGNVGDVGLGGGDAAPGDAFEQASGE
jgi:hypothetical protein